MDTDPRPKGRPLAVDPKATSAEPCAPAFIAPPQGAPVYYGFVVLDDVVVDGFTLGKITDFEAERTDYGDGFVIAPDDSRCGVVWEVSANPHFVEVLPPDANRWGVWGVSFPHSMTSRQDARRNLEFILPRLKQEWIRWRERYAKEAPNPE